MNVGVVLQSFGSGNVSNGREDILQCFKNAYEKGVIIINISQCNHGGVKGLYRAGSILNRYGVISGIDMTPEAALSKLAYVLANPNWTIEDKRRVMSEDLRGEISINISTDSFMKTKRPIKDNLIMGKKVVIMAMCSAARIGDITMLEKIGEYYKQWDCCNQNGQTPLHIASKANQINVVKFLLSKGMKNINMTDRNNYTPLLNAITSKSDPYLVQLLIKNGAYISKDKFVEDIVLKCVIKDEIATLKLFHISKYDFNIVDNDLNTPLHLAVINNHHDLVVWLVEMVSVKRDSKNKLGRTALDEANARNCQMIFEFLRRRDDY